MSPRDIHAIIKEEEARRSTSKAYKLFIEGKRPLEVAVAFKPIRARSDQNIEYWKLKRLHVLSSIHERQMANFAIWEYIC